MSPKSKSRLFWALVLLLPIVSFAAVAAPVWWIQPFAIQTPTKLAISYALKRAMPIASILVVLVCVYLAARLWRNARWWGRIPLVLLCAFTLLPAWFSQKNHFEWMFRPLPGPGFVAVEAADFVAEPEMVLAVSEGNESAAYPIRQIAYHHVVQDTVGGVPIVVTY